MKSLFYIVILFLVSSVQASTSFFIEGTSGKALAKSYDWNLGHGMVVVNKKNMEKSSFFLTTQDIEKKWISKYGSITFNQFATEFPNGGMNEAGLVVESTDFSEAKFSAQDSREALSQLQWIQYQLDMHATVQEVVANLRDIRLVNSFKKVHYLVCDVTKECAVIELIDGIFVSHLNNKVITNDNITKSNEHLRLFTGFGGTLPIPTDNSSLSRYVKVNYSLSNFRRSQRNNVIEASFTTLNTVRHNLESSGSTVWNIVYDLENLRIHFVHTLVGKKKYINLAEADYLCLNSKMIYNIESHQGSDNIIGDMLPYKKSYNQRIAQASLKDRIGELPPNALKNLIELPDTFTCVE